MSTKKRGHCPKGVRLQRTGIVYRTDDPRYWKEYHEKFRKPKLEAKKAVLKAAKTAFETETKAQSTAGG